MASKGSKKVSKRDLKTAHTALLEACDRRELLNLFGKCCNNRNLENLVFDSLKVQKEILVKSLETIDEAFFDNVAKQVEIILENQLYVPESAFEDASEASHSSNKQNTSHQEELQYLILVCQFMDHSLHFEILKQLHDSLEELDPDWSTEACTLYNKILSLCEKYYLGQRPHKEQVILQVLPVLVESALEGTKSDIVRLYQIRDALNLIDFDDSIEFTELLLRTVSSTNVWQHGTKLLASLLTFPVIGRKIHLALRIQIPDMKVSILESVGGVYWLAWKDNGSTEFLQDLIYAELHASNPKLSANLNIVMGKFHNLKNQSSVEKLLHDLYGPLLWRALAAANSQVRIQATKVLGRVFPLRCPGANNYMPKAVLALSKVLQDDQPRVRLAASAAAVSILSIYWDVIGSTNIHKLLNHIVSEHASDASSAMVRVGAVTAISNLLDYEPSHAVLRELLPSIGNLIHDKSDKVRLAVVKLLIQVKMSVKAIKFYHVVPLDHVHARFTAEENPTGPIVQALTKLTLNSYFPTNNPDALMERTLIFITENSAAAHVFYANVHKFRETEDIAELMVNLLKYLSISIEEPPPNHKRRRREESETQSISMPHFAAISETLCILWDSIECDLQNSKDWNQFLVDEFSGESLTNILEFFDHASEQDDFQRACSAILRCAGRLPAKAVEGLVPYVKSVLESVNENDSTVTPHLALLCLWDMTDEVASSLAAAICDGYDQNFLISSPEKKKRRSNRNITLEVPQLPPRMALSVLGDILRGAEPSSVAARKAIFSSETARDSIEQVLEEGIHHTEQFLKGIESGLDECHSQFLLGVCEAFGRYALHKEAFGSIGKIQFSDHAKTILHWTTQTVIPALQRWSNVPVFQSSDTGSPDRDTAGRRKNRGQTPVKADDSDLSSIEEEEEDDDNSVTKKKYCPEWVLAVSLIKASCKLFSEWMAVGGVGANFVGMASSGWCSILHNESSLSAELVPAFCRLALMLAKNESDLSLLKSLIVHVSDDEDCHIQKVAVALLSNSKVAEDALKLILSLCHEMVNQESSTGDNELTIEVQDLWQFESGCILSALGPVFRNKSASLLLARNLVENLGSQSPKCSLFDMKCLFILCDKGSRVCGDVTTLVGGLHANFENDASLGNVWDELVDGLQT